MSESTGPASPAAPTTADTSADTSYAPPPDSRPELSVSDAARLLRNARRAQAPAGQPGYGHNSGEPAPISANNQPQRTDQTSGVGERGSVPAAQPSGVEALEAALGLKPGDVPTQGSTPAPSTPPTMADIEIEGQRWTHSQLRDAVLMARDYTQKTQAIAEQARQLQAQQQALAAALPLIQPEIEALQRRLMDAPRPDPALRATDPAAYWDQLASWQDAQIEQQRVMQLNQMQAQARDAAMAQQVAQANAELAQKYPFWSDPQQRQQVQHSIVAWARTQGYTDQELQGLTNPRYLETLFKASLFDKHVASVRGQAPTSSVQVQTRGAAPPPAPAARITQAQEAFEQRPNIANAAALIAARRAPRPNGHSNW